MIVYHRVSFPTLLLLLFSTPPPPPPPPPTLTQYSFTKYHVPLQFQPEGRTMSSSRSSSPPRSLGIGHWAVVKLPLPPTPPRGGWTTAHLKLTRELLLQRYTVDTRTGTGSVANGDDSILCVDWELLRGGLERRSMSIGGGAGTGGGGGTKRRRGSKSYSGGSGSGGGGGGSSTSESSDDESPVERTLRRRARVKANARRRR